MRRGAAARLPLADGLPVGLVVRGVLSALAGHLIEKVANA